MKNTISIRQHIKFDDIKDLLDSASRGSDYWSGNALAYESETKRALTKKGIPIWDLEAEPKYLHHLNLAKIKKGLTIMAKKYPNYFGYFINKDYDGNTGDIFLQCCLFGDVIYG